MSYSVSTAKRKRASAASKIKSIVEQKRRGPPSKSQTLWRRCALNNHGQTTQSTRGRSAISFLARSPARRDARTHRRFLGILSGQTERARVRATDHRRNGRAFARDRRSHPKILRELRVPPHRGGRSQHSPPRDL